MNETYKTKGGTMARSAFGMQLMPLKMVIEGKYLDDKCDYTGAWNQPLSHGCVVINGADRFTPRMPECFRMCGDNETNGVVVAIEGRNPIPGDTPGDPLTTQSFRVVGVARALPFIERYGDVYRRTWEEFQSNKPKPTVLDNDWDDEDLVSSKDVKQLVQEAVREALALQKQKQRKQPTFMTHEQAFERMVRQRTPIFNDALRQVRKIGVKKFVSALREYHRLQKDYEAWDVQHQKVVGETRQALDAECSAHKKVVSEARQVLADKILGQIVAHHD